MSHVILVSDPWSFESKHGSNRVRVEFEGRVPGPGRPNWSSELLLFRVCDPFEHDGQSVDQLVAAPRYVGTSLEHLFAAGGSVGVARVLAGKSVRLGQRLRPDDVEYIIIGEVQPAAED